MSRKRVDISGKRFSHLVAVECVGVNKQYQTMWLCKCDCGNTKIVPANKLKSGDYKSCGCMQHKGSHGQTNTRLYHIWRTMKARCVDANSNKYSAYGGRGITVCDEWLNDFKSFYDWAMSNGYRDSLSIDRIDNNGNYCQENCRWATPKEQANNTRKNRLLMFDGVSRKVSEWADITGLSKRLIYQRLNRGWSAEKTLTTPLK